ncbi:MULTISPECIES: transposase [Desulfovibrio]|uniref:Transposase of IS4/5 family n=1 Tax=Desulfovibrio desulfuricans TaxID=876 RepID=A0AA94HRV3_DESDE|nr:MULTISPECIES: transposase [Desulfovibrio]ATD81448.1 hypothetical protein CNY67_08710 [Desulfovibrio sp. G11]SFW36226.1 Putative transposase of IS4/5 family [Desulfovibrio desulfuricans]SPD34141.1 Putative transposase IS4/5 family [Desulfovibrio sp. G11]
MSRHDISDEKWAIIRPMLAKTGTETRGRKRKDDRLIFNAILWIMKTGAPWRDLHPEFGPWNTVSAGAGGLSITGGSAFAGVHAESGGANDIISHGAINIKGHHGLQADGSNNLVTAHNGEVTISGSGGSYVDPGSGIHAANGGTNTITGNAPLTVAITATGATAEKAIAMWADGGGSVNYITGHPRAGGPGDSVTLTANNGQGIAMQAENGGKNIITTGAGNDSVLINGAVKGNGNEINLGGGDNTLTINGAVQTGSLNVIAAGGTYTLVLQASNAENFAARYGDWLNAIGSDPLIAGGMTGISFEGLSFSPLPTDFLSTFNDLLWALHDGGTSIEPPELVTQLHDPAAPFATPLAATLAETDAEHHTQDAQHAAQDSAQDTTWTAHDGPTLLADDSLNAAFNAQTDNTGTQTDVFEPDATAQTSFAMDEEEEGQVQPLFAFLDDHATDTSASMFLEEGDDALHNGYLGNEGENSGDFAGVHTSITLTYGDESLDSLFTAGGVVTGTNETGNVPSVMDSCQEATDSAAREMTSC